MHKAIRVTVKILCGVVVLALVLCILIFAGASYLNAPPEEPPHPMEEAMRIDKNGALFLDVKSGETASSVGRRLENAGIIRSRYFWYLLSRFENDYV
ncbi:MAG: aminodeoxychorismate lyase, partial [Treponema sp.]|nr:aminodeoxychorismate lyase [Treponema sp.]